MRTAGISAHLSLNSGEAYQIDPVTKHNFSRRPHVSNVPPGYGVSILRRPAECRAGQIVDLELPEPRPCRQSVQTSAPGEVH